MSLAILMPGADGAGGPRPIPQRLVFVTRNRYESADGVVFVRT
ncbi:hypothetical protein M2352_001201 [Azospirillum fermentarium]|nr:hypothetical protein [Azospirillum fermentarium]MCW2245610.1 hypothetical protein [Azospirillum fermentarium]